MNWVKACAFYTPGAYAEEAKLLSQSAQKYGVWLETREFGHLATWQDAVCFKPQFILLMLEEMMRSQCAGLLYVDADARFTAWPDWSIFDGCELSGAHFQWSPRHARELLTGTLYFKNDARVMDFVRSWGRLTTEWAKKDRDTPEQNALIEAIATSEKEQNPIRFKELPIEWCFIEGDEFARLHPGKRASILQTQASRRFRLT